MHPLRHHPHPANISSAFWRLWIRLRISWIGYVQPVSEEGFFSPIYNKVLNSLSRETPLERKPEVWASTARLGHACFASSALAHRVCFVLFSPNLPCKCCDCDCVWDFFLEVHLSLLLFLVSVGLVWGGSSFVVRYLRSSEQGRLCGFCCWQMLFALLLHEFSVLKTRHKES